MANIKNATLCVPEVNAEAYRSVSPWMDFATIETVLVSTPQLPDGLYYAGTDGKLYFIDNDGKTTVLDTEEFPHTFQLVPVGDRIYGASAGTKFTYSPTAQVDGDGKLFYLFSQDNGELASNIVLDNKGGNHNRDPYGLAKYGYDIYVYDRSETVRKLTYTDKTISQDYPSWLENSWIDFYGNGWAYGCIKSDMQVTEVTDANGITEPVFWLMMNYSGNGLYRFKSAAVNQYSGNRDSSYNKVFLPGIRSTAFYIDEANGHLYVYKQASLESGLYRVNLSDISNTSLQLIDGSPVRNEGTSSEPVGIPQLSVDANGEYLYWCYRAPTSESDYDSTLWKEDFNASNPLHRTGIKRIKLGETKPKVEMVAEGAEGYGVAALNFKGTGQNSVMDIADDTLAEGPVEYYNLQGIRILNPQPGSIVIRRQGSHATKVRYN